MSPQAGGGRLIRYVKSSHNGIQARARASAASSALTQAKRKLELYKVDNTTYPTSGSLANAGITDTANATYQYTSTTGATYCLTATNGTTSYYVDSATQPNPTQGGCPGHGRGWVAAITNLATDPSFETTTITGAYSITVLDTTWKESGASSISVTPTGASGDTHIHPGGDLGGLRLGMQAGKTYTISATIRLVAPLTGSFASNGARQITAWYTLSGAHTLVRSPQAANVAGQTRLSVTYTIPAGATAAWIRLYHGGMEGSGTVWWDNLMVAEGSTPYNYADDSSTNWVWNGTANASTSTGPPS